MAFSGINSTSSTSHRNSFTTLAEINVTPLVDVMLVLLIVFMISAPLMQQGIQVNLPKANTGSLNETPNQIVLVLEKTRKLSIGNQFIPENALAQKLTAITASKPDVEVVIQADQSLNYGYIAKIMGEVKKAGVTRVGLVTEPTR